MQYTYFEQNVTLRLVNQNGRFVEHVQTGDLYPIGNRGFTLGLCIKLVKVIRGRK